MSDNKSSYGINIILYPRAYNKRGGESLHSVQGMTSDGRIVNVKLRLSDDALSRDNYPSVLEFSRTDAKANQSCFLKTDNSPEDREGVLLFSQAHSDGFNSQGIDSYVAKWASVLAQRSESPDPVIGVGRVEIKKNLTLIKSLEEKLSHYEEKEDFDAIEKIKSEIKNPKNFSYSLITYFNQSICSERSNQIDDLKSKIILSFNEYKKNIHIPGFFIRAVNKEGRILFGSYYEHFAKYNNLEEKYQSIVEMVDHFIDVVEPKLSFNYFNNENFSLEVCPLSKVVAGKTGKNYFGQDYKYKFLKKMFYSKESSIDQDSIPMLCNIAAKVYSYDDKFILSGVYPISHQLGDPKRIDSNGRFTRVFEDEETKLSQMEISSEEATPKEIGFSYNYLPSRSTWIIHGKSSPISSSKIVLNEKESKATNSSSHDPIPLRDVVSRVDADLIDSNKKSDIEIIESSNLHKEEVNNIEKPPKKWIPDLNTNSNPQPQPKSEIEPKIEEDKEIVVLPPPPEKDDSRSSVVPGAEIDGVKDNAVDEIKDDVASNAGISLDDSTEEKEEKKLTGMAAFIKRKNNK